MCSVRLIGVWLALGASACALAASSAPAATSSTVVGANVPSATNLSLAGCPSGSASLDFGSVTAGASLVTTADCTIVFGSSNDTAKLRIAQSDGLGLGMWQPTRGVLTAGFGASGIAALSPSSGAANDIGYAAVVQPDGLVVVAGACDMGGLTGQDICVERLLANGMLDPAFGSGGVATTAIAPTTGSDIAYAVALQGDGRIVVAGSCSMGGGTGPDVCLARYLTNGTPDPGFGTSGVVSTPIGPGTRADFARGVAIQSDGKIVVAGYCDMGATNGIDACLARYTTTGALDTTGFGTGGIVSTATAAGAANDYAYSVAIQADGRIVVAGACDIGGASGTDVCLSRYDTAGALDPGFGTGGRVTTAIAPTTGGDFANAMALQPDARIVVAGSCGMGGATGTDFCSARYNSDGTLDTSFDTDGIVTTDIAPGAANDIAHALVVGPGGRIVAGGSCTMGGATGQDACVARYLPNGTLDALLDGDGKLTTATAPGAAADYFRGLALNADGTMNATGMCDQGGATGQDACVIQYGGGSGIAQYSGASNWGTGSTNLFASCLHGLANATPTWTLNAGCLATDVGGFWNAVPTSPTQIATADPLATNASVSLVFGLRTLTNQPAGSYVAPVTFSVVAP
jgi:uncharacterized delta-60 repeat protein